MTGGGEGQWYGRLLVIGSWGTVLGLWLVTLFGPLRSGFEGSVIVASINIAAIYPVNLLLSHTLQGVYSIGVIMLGLGVILTGVGVILVHVTYR